MTNQIQPSDVKKVASLANLTITEEETNKFATQFSDTLKVVDRLSEIDTHDIKGASEVHGLQNVTREDRIDKTNILSQLQALQNATKTHKGFFVVPRIIDQN